MTKSRRVDPMFAAAALLTCCAAGLLLWAGTRSVAQAARPVAAAPVAATLGGRVEPAPIPRLNLSGTPVAMATESRVEVPAAAVTWTSVPATLPGSETADAKVEANAAVLDDELTSSLVAALQGRMSFVSQNLSVSFGQASVPTFTADFDGSGELGPDDIAEFLADFYSASPSAKADFDHDGEFTPDDVAALLKSYFDGEQTMEAAPITLTLIQNVQFSFDAQEDGPQEMVIEVLNGDGNNFRLGSAVRVLQDQIGPATPAPAPR